MAMTSERTITASNAGEGDVYAIGPEMVTIKMPGSESDGAHLVIEVGTPSGGGPPLHTHPAEEIFLIIEGEFEFPTLRNGRTETTRASAGGVVHIPGGAPHTYHNAGSGYGRVLCVLTPAAEMEGFFREAGTRMANAAPSSEPAPLDMERFFAIAHKYHMEFILPTGQ